MDTTTILIIIAVIALIAFWLYNRNKPAPHGTYNDPDVRSSGSIGGGTRSYDDPDVRSSGSIGGGTRSHDSPKHSSGGSIGGSSGGRQQTENNKVTREHSTQQPRVKTQEERATDSNFNLPLSLPKNDVERQEEQKKRNEDEFRSGGSFGGSQS